MNKSSCDLIELTKALCAIPTAVVADGNEALFARLAKELPLELFRFKSGDSFNGWIVPDNWRVKRAQIFRDGMKVFDGAGQALAVGYYSNSFSGELHWEELKPKLVTNPALPDIHVANYARSVRADAVVGV